MCSAGFGDRAGHGRIRIFEWLLCTVMALVGHVDGSSWVSLG